MFCGMKEEIYRQMTRNENNNNTTRDEVYIATQPWMEWKHVNKGKTHCDTCLKLDKCWFVKSNMPKIPHHAYCHCTTVPKSTRTVLREAKATSPIQKFSEYLFNADNPQNKGKAVLFEQWGYNAVDSEWMAEETQRQARKKYIKGEYLLGNLDEYGQRINIHITIPDRITGEMRIFRSAWMVRPNGE